MAMLVYSFRTFKETEKLREIFGDYFTFGPLKKGLHAFQQVILEQQPRYILGVAASRYESRFEPVAVNSFNNNSLIRGGPSKLLLHTPLLSEGPLRIAAKPTHSFCNWTMYNLQYFILEHRLTTKLMFAHVKVQDIHYLRDLIDNKRGIYVQEH